MCRESRWLGASSIQASDPRTVRWVAVLPPLDVQVKGLEHVGTASLLLVQAMDGKQDYGVVQLVRPAGFGN